MPELPEVERAAKLIRDTAKGRIIQRVETTEDTIVYSGTSHDEFATELTGRKVLDVKRKGKVFWLELEGSGRLPVMHFGMTGMIQVKGQEPIWYQSRPKDKTDEWPPKFWKFVLHFDAIDDLAALEIAFRDPRRLGRIRLCSSVLEEPPVSKLGFDPILSMPTLAIFSGLVKARNMPIKALLLDQTFSAGVGNWVADEILYHSGIHPERRANALNDEELSTLFEKMTWVCEVAVAADADSSKFPENWLFKHRWSKGKKQQGNPFILPSGETAKIKWITVGGRTSAVVEQCQSMSKSLAGPVMDLDDRGAAEGSKTEEVAQEQKRQETGKRKSRRQTKTAQSEEEDPSLPLSKRRKKGQMPAS